MADTLDVYLSTELVGTLESDVDGRMTFRYAAADPSLALSLSLPPRTEPYDDTACRPFFAGLLLEGAALQRAADTKRLQVYETFKLLRVFGAECAGVVRLLAPGDTPQIKQNYELLEGERLANEIRAIDQAPNFARDGRVRLSIAGVQAKTAVKVAAEGIFKPLDGSPSTHILKIGSDKYPDLPKNEAFCLQLAARDGIPTSETELRMIDGLPVLLVRRYDRTIDGDVIAERHQEDFCQALGYPPAAKYEVDEDTGDKIGPGFAECAALIRKTRRPAVEIQTFVRRILFNYLVGNADAHAKNLSLLYDGHAELPSLAPLYDVVCTRLYPAVADHFAMRHGGILDPAKMSKSAWEQLADDLGVRFSLIERSARNLGRMILPEARALMATAPFTQHPPYARILTAIGDRLRHLSDDLGLGIPTDTPPFLLRAPGWDGMSS
ncbi:MAG: type II toxin-antitoxin system HipA family toxin [Stellaceae bacterium]